MRALGIDFGERRIGLALSEPAGRLAVPLTTFERGNDRTAVRRIAEIARREEVEVLVLGDPVNLDGSRGDAAERIDRFADKLAAATELPIERIPETLTTVEARERLRRAGIDLRKKPEKLDATAAQIVLEDFLARRATDPPAPVRQPDRSSP